MNKHRAHMPASATTPLIFFNICSPKWGSDRRTMLRRAFCQSGQSAASRPQPKTRQLSRGLKLVAETYLCIRNEREAQTLRRYEEPPVSGFQPLTRPLFGWMHEVGRHAA